MWRSSLWLLYWVSTAIRTIPALTRLDNAKSINRYSPPNGTAGLALSRVSGKRRLPSPPASTMPSTFGSDIRRLLQLDALNPVSWEASGYDTSGHEKTVTTSGLLADRGTKLWSSYLIFGAPLVIENRSGPPTCDLKHATQ